MPDQTGKFVQMTLLIPITGDVFKDTPTITPALKAVEDFRKALDAAKLPKGWTLETEQITRRGPKTASAPTAVPGQQAPWAAGGKPDQVPAQAAEPPADAPDEPPLPLDGESASEAPRPAWTPGAAQAAQ